MDRCEVEKLFTLFSQFWPNKQVTTKMKLAWEIALEPYGYADVRAAAVAYARRNKFFPDVADITMGIEPQEEQAQEEQAQDTMERFAWMRDYVHKERKLGRISRYAREHGMTWQEAKEALDG